MQPADESSLIKTDRSAPALRAVPPETRLATHISASTLNLFKRYSSEILPTEHSVEVLPDYCEVESITYSPDGRYLALGCPSNHQIRILETVNYTVFSVIKLSDHYFNTLDFSPSSKELAFDMQGAIWIWDIENGRHTKTLNCNCEYISEIKYSPAGQFIAAIVKGDIIQIWDIKNVTCTAEIAIHSETHIEGCHERMIISPDGKILALSDSGGDVHLWSTNTGKFLKVMQIPSSFMCFSPDSKYIAGCNANIITIWNIKTSKCVKCFEEQSVNIPKILRPSEFGFLSEYEFHHAHNIEALTYLKNGKTVASASNDKTIRLWNIRTGKCSITNLTKHHIVDQGVFSPDFKYLAAGRLSSIQIINIDTGRIFKTLNKYRLGVQSAAFSGNSKTLFLAQFDGVVELWNFEECKCISVSKVHDHTLYPTKPHKDNVNFTFISTEGEIITWNTQRNIVVKTPAVSAKGFVSCVSVDGRFFVLQRHGAKPQIWSSVPVKHMATFDFEFSPWQRNKSLSPNNKTLAVSDEKEAAILLLDTEKGTCYDKIHVTSDSPAGMKVNDITFCYSPDGETIALSIDLSYASSCVQTKGIDIRLWNIASAKFTTTLRGHQRRITSLIFSPDGKILASSSFDDTIRLWSTETGACLKVLSTNEDSLYYKTVFSPDGKTLVTIGRSTQLWDVDTGQLLRTLYTFGEKWAAVTPDGYYAGSRNCEELLLFRNKRTGHIEPPQNHRAKLYSPEKVKFPKK